jgi:hypothetical protein
VPEDEAVARAAVHKTLAACTQAGDSRKADAYAACFTSDGILDLGDPIEGREAIRQWLTAPSVIPKPENIKVGFVSHHLTTCRIDFDSAATASVRTYWLVVTANGLDHSGYYDDRFRKVGDDWLIEYRRPRTLWRAPASLVAN